MRFKRDDIQGSVISIYSDQYTMVEIRKPETVSQDGFVDMETQSTLFRGTRQSKKVGTTHVECGSP